MPDTATRKERRRIMSAANDIFTAKRTGKRKQAIPAPVWASTSQRDIAAALQKCGAGEAVSMAVWKSKRNRAVESLKSL